MVNHTMNALDRSQAVIRIAQFLKAHDVHKPGLAAALVTALHDAELDIVMRRAAEIDREAWRLTCRTFEGANRYLIEAFNKFAQHDKRCSVFSFAAPNTGCSCGFDQVNMIVNHLEENTDAQKHP